MNQRHLNKQEVNIAFRLWELLSQLDALLWDRYFDQFNDKICEEEKDRNIKDQFPF